MADLQKFQAELTAEHDALTKAYEAQQVVAEREWAKLDAAKVKLTDFRSKYGKVLKALKEGAVKVEG